MYGFIHAWFALPTVLEQIRVVDRLPRRAVAQFRERDTGRVVPDDTLGLALWAPHHRPQLVDLGDRLLRGRWEGQIANGRRELLGLADHLGPVSSAHDAMVSAIEETIKSGPRTPDLGGTANTTQVGEAIAARIAAG